MTLNSVQSLTRMKDGEQTEHFWVQPFRLAASAPEDQADYYLKNYVFEC